MNLDQTCLCELRQSCELRQQRNLIISVTEQKGIQRTVFSDGWIALTGIIPKKLQDIRRLAHPDDLDEFDLNWNRATNSHRQFDFRIEQHDGKYLWLLADLVPIHDSKISGVVATFIDITNRKISELVFLANYNLIDLIFNSLHAFIAYVGTDKCYKYVNKAYSEFFEQECHKICGQTVEDLLGEAYPRVEIYLDQALSGKKVKYEVEVFMLGKLRRCSTTLIPHFDDGGEVKGVFVFVEQIGDQKVISSHLEDIERFMAHWQPKPREMCHFVGRAVARIAHRNIPDLFFAISTAYFAFREICQRIDYIYLNYQKKVGGECGKLLKELVDIVEQREIICLKDIGGKHYGIRVMLIRDIVDGYSTYSLRYFVKTGERATGYLKTCWRFDRPTFQKVLNPLSEGSPQQYENDYSFWNFRSLVEPLEGVIVYPDAQGFYDLRESKSIADFIVLTSNLLGYDLANIS